MPSYKKQILELLETINVDEYSLMEISKMIGCDIKTITNNFRILNINKKICRPHARDQYKRINELIANGYNQAEIAKELNLSVRQVTIFCDNKKIKNPNTTKKKIDITDTEYQIILGSLLGDGHITKYGQMAIKHSSKQKEYVIYKNSFLKRFNCYYKDLARFDNRTNEVYYSSSIMTKAFLELKHFRNTWYIPNKQVNESIYDISGLGIAIWFMDDGFKNGNSITLSTDSFTDNCLLMLQDMFLKNFNINVRIIKNNRITIATKEYYKFYNLVLPFMIPSMMYKLPIPKVK